MMPSSILFVDDDEKILRGIERQHGDDFDVEIAVGSQAALERFRAGEQFAVVVSDMRMPDISGIELLKEVRHLSPDTIRVMLTGYADLDSMIKSVNNGVVFRFLIKPCSDQALARCLSDSLNQFHCIQARDVITRQVLPQSLRALIFRLTEDDHRQRCYAERFLDTFDTVARYNHFDVMSQVAATFFVADTIRPWEQDLANQPFFADVRHWIDTSRHIKQTVLPRTANHSATIQALCLIDEFVTQWISNGDCWNAFLHVQMAEPSYSTMLVDSLSHHIQKNGSAPFDALSVSNFHSADSIAS